jgi:murein DD-endopeptidase MepM/ murein hydrolase activator NlpD
MADDFTWPLLVNVIRGQKVSNTFGMVRTDASGSPKPHQGWDLAAAVGSPVYAVADGTVEYVQSGGDYGNRICIRFEHKGKTYYAFYAHLMQASKEAGASVEMNDQIGYTGKSGNASNLPTSEDHLHFEIRTSPSPGLGLVGRISPLKLYGLCPLTAPIAG